MANADFNNGFNKCLDDYLEQLKGNKQQSSSSGGNPLTLPNLPKDFKQEPQDNQNQDQQSGSGSSNSQDNKDKKEQDQQSSSSSSGSSSDKEQSSQKDGKSTTLTGLPTGKLLSTDEMNEIRNKIKSDKNLSDELKDAISDTLSTNSVANNEEAVETKNREFSRKIANKNKICADFLDGILEASAKYANLWKKILKGFIASNATFAGKMTTSDEIKWGSRKGIARGEIKPFEVKKPKQPQFINLCIDTSGSINIELLEEFAQTIASLAKSKLYSGINIIPWDDNVYETINVDTKHGDLFEELKHCINLAKSAGGGGTELSPLVNAIISESQKNKKDLYIIISDGECSTNPLNKIPANVMKNCIAIIYNSSNNVFSDWMKYFDNKHFASIKL